MDKKDRKGVSFKPGKNKDLLQLVFDKESAQDMIHNLQKAIKTYHGEFYYNTTGTITFFQP